MPADDHLNSDQVGPVYHGTNFRWKELGPAQPNRPFHVATHPDFPADYADRGGIIKEFSVHPDAKIHRPDLFHSGGEQPLPDEEHDMVMREGYDMTMFKDHLGVVWNTGVLKHERDIPVREYHRNPGKWGPPPS